MRFICNSWTRVRNLKMVISLFLHLRPLPDCVRVQSTHKSESSSNTTGSNTSMLGSHSQPTYLHDGKVPARLDRNLMVQLFLSNGNLARCVRTLTSIVITSETPSVQQGCGHNFWTGTTQGSSSARASLSCCNFLFGYVEHLVGVVLWFPSGQFPATE